MISSLKILLELLCPYIGVNGLGYGSLITFVPLFTKFNLANKYFKTARNINLYQKRKS